MSRIFAITDIETTGSHASANSITEIAVVLTDGMQEIDRFQSLVRPEHSIPFHITQLTGITNEMVAEAPHFENIAEELYDWFGDTVFVAHNVGFDYAFIKKCFEAYGYYFHLPRLCTVRLARKIFPGLPSYSLGRICDRFGIANEARHRAMGDTLATVELFHRMVAQDEAGIIEHQLKRGNAAQWLPQALPEEEFHRLPERAGVYYFHDRSGKILYIGMSSNVKKRIRQHFGGKMQSKRRQAFLSDIASISFELTGTVAIARLLEDAEIRKHWPPFNFAQKRTAKKFTISRYSDRMGYIRWCILPLKSGMEGELVFHNLAEARDAALAWCRRLDLHPYLLGLHQTGEPLPDPEIHNKKLEALWQELVIKKGRVVVRGEGRKESEDSFVWIENGELVGYGYVERNEDLAADRVELLEQYLKPLPSSEMTRSIITELVRDL